MNLKGHNFSEFKIKGDYQVNDRIKNCILGYKSLDPGRTVRQKITDYYTVTKGKILVQRKEGDLVVCVIVTNDPNVYFMRLGR